MDYSLINQIDRYIKYCKTQKYLSPKTIDAYKTDVNQMLPKMDDKISATILMLLSEISIIERTPAINPFIKIIAIAFITYIIIVFLFESLSKIILHILLIML